MFYTNAAKSIVRQALYLLSYSINAMHNMWPIVDLLASIIELKEAGANNGLKIFS